MGTDDDGWTPEPGVGEPDETRELGDLDLLAELTHPVRSQVLRALRRPRTVAQVAELLGVPVTRLYHHVNRLEALGFIRVVATRRVAAVTERRYQVVAKSWRASPELVTTSDPRELAAALGALFDLTRFAFQREVESGGFDGIDQPEEHSLLTQAQRMLTPARRAELLRRLSDLLDEYTGDDDDDESDPDAVRTTMFVAVFPETS